METPLLGNEQQRPDALPRYNMLDSATARDSRERAEVDDELRRSENLFFKAFNASPEPMILSRLEDGVYLFVNESFILVSGWSRDEAIGRSSLDLNLWANPDDSPRLIRKLAEEGRIYKEEIDFKIKSGELRTGLFSAEIIDVGGERCVLSLASDITERKQAEKRLRESEERYRVVAETTSDAIITFREDGVIVFTNHAAGKIFNCPVEQLIGSQLIDFIPDFRSHLSHADAAVTVAERGSGSRLAEMIGVCCGAVSIQLEASFGAFNLENRRLFTVIARDISRRKRIAEELRRSEEYQKLFRMANDAILIFNHQGETIIDVNDRACEIYGCERAQFIGRSLSELSMNEPREKEYLKTLIAQGLYQSFETIHRRPDGTAINVHINSSIIEYQGDRAVLSINRDITSRKRAEEQLVHDAFHDALTGLPNRALFLDHLKLAVERAKRRGDNHLFAVLFLDLDRFKVVNESLGHVVGDQLLITIARRLASCLRPGDTVARLGGDEFTILLDDIKDAGDAIRLAKLIQEVLRSPFSLDGHEVFTTVSIGIALSATGYDYPEDLLRDADTAMYRAKSLGKARHEVFDNSMHAHAMEQLQLEIDLRRAIERQEFCIHYQPIVSLENNRLSGFEALVRWQHPERGLVAPERFIPVAEENGLIIPIGQLVLGEACRQMRRWQRQFPALQPLSISVNLSSKQLTQPDLIEQIKQSLQRSGLDPTSLKLEITESVVMENTETAINMLLQLRALRVALSIDDFGTGYSSLSYLHRFPVSTLKIDRSFVSRLGNNDENGEIVKTIIMLAQNLKMDVVAEGVENEEQMQLLKKLHCEYAQGYLISKPVDTDAAGALLRAYSQSMVQAEEFDPVEKIENIF